MPQTHLYVGCYTHRSEVGIRVYDASDPDGRLVERSEVRGVDHPSYLVAHPNGRVLYSVSETAAPDGSAASHQGAGDSGGGVVAYAIARDGALRVLDRVASWGDAPCHVSLDARGRQLFVANYVSGSVAAYDLAPDGRFGPLRARRGHIGSGPSPRQAAAHAHCIVPGPDGTSVHAVDLGADRVFRYRRSPAAETSGALGLEPDGELVLDPGSGPRHLVFHPHRPVAYLVCELSCTVEALAVDPIDGTLTRTASASTLPAGYAGPSIAAEIRIDHEQERVYASNRGHDSIAVFAIDDPAVPLRSLGHVATGGRTPRNIAVHPSGRALWAANQDSDTIRPFRLTPGVDLPEPLGVTYDVVEPVCLTFVSVRP